MNLPINPSNCSEREHQILAVIGEQIVDIDFICEQTKLATAVVSALLMMLDLAGVIERLDDDQFKRNFFDHSLVKPRGPVKAFVKKFVKYLKRCKCGISRKYVHRHIARFWCLIDRERWKEGRLLEECLHAHHIPRIALRLENAPLMVQLPPLAD